MGVPTVAIVGRPNVGKSSLFNWLAGRRLAVVDNRAGVTRDRVTHLLCLDDRYLELVDTGGMGMEDEDQLTPQVESQIEAALDSADVILFVVDTRAGLLPLDGMVARRLRQASAPVILVANKTDAPSMDAQANEFYGLDCGEPILVSTQENRHRQDLVDAILARLPAAPAEEPSPVEPEMKLAIVGRRNTGKSTFVNTLVQAERMIVSEVPGTTRDSVDVRFELDGKAFVAIDTPGFRRTRSLANDMEFYSTHRAQRAIRRADVVLLFFDPTERISKVDRQLSDYIAEQYKPCIFVVNKWDLLAGSTQTNKWVRYLRDTFRTLAYAPIAFITGQTGKNVKALINHAQHLFKQARSRMGTSELNSVIHAAVARHEPPLHQNRQPKIYYATQVSVQPPTLVVFCSDPQGISPDYRRYLLGVVREQSPFTEIPIKLYLRARRSSGGGNRPAGRGGKPADDEASPDDESIVETE